MKIYLSSVNSKVAQRFWEKVDIQGPNECWEWKASLTGAGYGQFWGQLGVNRKRVDSHRFAYELVKGPIPSGFLVRHSCDIKRCCNPQHLILGTQQDNMGDRVERGQTPRGSDCSWSKLTENDIPEIRVLRDRGNTLRSIANRFSVSIASISLICSRKSWKYLS